MPQKRGRSQKDKEGASDKELKRLEKPPSPSLGEMLSDLPTCCDIGSKVNNQELKISWKGYKLHLDTINRDYQLGGLQYLAVLFHTNGYLIKEYNGSPLFSFTNFSLLVTD